MLSGERNKLKGNIQQQQQQVSKQASSIANEGFLYDSRHMESMGVPGEFNV